MVEINVRHLSRSCNELVVHLNSKLCRVYSLPPQSSPDAFSPDKIGSSCDLVAPMMYILIIRARRFSFHTIHLQFDRSMLYDSRNVSTLTSATDRGILIDSHNKSTTNELYLITLDTYRSSIPLSPSFECSSTTLSADQSISQMEDCSRCSLLEHLYYDMSIP